MTVASDFHLTEHHSARKSCRPSITWGGKVPAEMLRRRSPRLFAIYRTEPGSGLFIALR